MNGLWIQSRLAAAVSLIAVAALVCVVVAARSGASKEPTLVIDTSFTLQTLDPQREFDPTASLVVRGIYDTLFTFAGNDLAHPVPLLARSWRTTGNYRTLTVQLREDAHFADGTPLTSADVVFSLRRLVNLRGSPAFLLSGIEVSANGTYGVVFRSKAPVVALRSILANPATGIVNAKLVRKHGGTAGANAYKADRAEPWLNSPASTGAGSGPYLLRSFSATSHVVMAPNPRYWRSRPPAFTAVVLRNMIAPSQLLHIQRDSHEIALDLSSAQAQPLSSNKRLRVSIQPSTFTFYIFANNDPVVSSVTSNKSFQQAVRYALDYPAFVGLAGRGAIQAPGLIPSVILGALPRTDDVKQDVARARAALASSGVGDQDVTLDYPSDLTINGVSFASIAQKADENLRAAGIKVTLSGSPATRFIPRFRGDKLAFAVWVWAPDYPDPSDYLVFAPGQLVGRHVGWAAGSDQVVERLAAKARVATKASERRTIYWRFQIALNQRGPYFPLFQPTQVFVSTTDLKNAVFNAVYMTDLTHVAPK